ncbi:lipoprotein [Pseudomonas sp. M47T1]|uniref:membrane protein n=1 Tax=unclassified Pseudomonas TaxID=196821 RepID=UPI0002606FE5|nr:membrane protein [Pseudomonas sp. M47T1]EIK94736.1 lipoprotein [Pseudomonas sp. M47T1]
MRVARTLMCFALLPLFAGCQLFSSAPSQPSTAGLTRMQGVLMGHDGQLLFQPCGEQRHYTVTDIGHTGVLQEAAGIVGKSGQVYGDVRGRFEASKTGGMDGTIDLQQFYRLERSAAACNDPNFKLLTLRAGGSDPAKWELRASGKGLELSRADQPPLAVPFVEEQMPDGRLSLSTEANGLKVELWVAPQRCVDPTTGSVQQMTAELRVNDQPYRGCAYFGGARND